MVTIAITGASGFIGQNLVSYLKSAGYKVFLISRNTNVDAALRINYDSFTSDFIKEHEIEAVIHLAGKAHDLNNSSADQEYYDVNTILTQKVYDVFRQSIAKQFFFMSTVKAIADKIVNELIEQTKPNPATVYGKSKKLAEEYLLTHMNDNQKIYILRPCMIHGPGNKGNFNLLYKFIKKGFPYPLAAIQNQRSFLSIENLCFVIGELLARTDVSSGVYNIADDQPLSTNRAIEIMCEVLGKKNRSLKISPVFIKQMAKIGDLLYLPFNSYRLQKLTESYVVSNAKLKAALGKELPVDVETGLRRTIQSFKNV